MPLASRPLGRVAVAAHLVALAHLASEGGRSLAAAQAVNEVSAAASTDAAATTTATSSSTTGTSTTTTETRTTTTTTTTTSTTTGAHIYGGEATFNASEGWLQQWRKLYRYGSPCGVVACLVPELADDLLPLPLRRVRPQVVISDGGVAGGVVTEGMGYGIMIEGFEAARGDRDALDRGLALVRSWLGMVRGPFWGQPLAGGVQGQPESSTEVDVKPYGVSAVGGGQGKAYAGLPVWKWPLGQCKGNCNGTASDGDQDAVLGMIYLAAALGYPADFVDMVMRTLIAFVSADLGFPDMYRTLPGGEKMFVPKMGSSWGGLTPPSGPFKTQQEPWCYSPGYFAPAHYRLFRDFAQHHWQPSFYAYMPPRSDGMATTLGDLVEALESAITAGYNILYRASCASGSVSNWVGVEAECKADPSLLHCEGVPWKHTPYVGAHKGMCNTSHTEFGQYGADASRAPWRIAMDYILFRAESNSIKMYDRNGTLDESLAFGSHAYLNRIVGQYKWQSKCDGGKPGDCLTPDSNPPYSPWQLSLAFDPEKTPRDLTCEGVPNMADSWWAGYMAYPTFTAFVAPYSALTPEESICWMDTFVSVCNFAKDEPTGSICGLSYFDISQEVISTMVMANKLLPLDAVQRVDATGSISMDAVHADAAGHQPVVGRAAAAWSLGRLPAWALTLAVAMAALGAVVRVFQRRSREDSYQKIGAGGARVMAAGLCQTEGAGA